MESIEEKTRRDRAFREETGILNVVNRIRGKVITVIWPYKRIGWNRDIVKDVRLKI